MRPLLLLPIVLLACTPEVTVDDLTIQSIDVILDHSDDGTAQFDLSWSAFDDCVRLDGVDGSTFGGVEGGGSGGGSRRGDFFNRICVNTGVLYFEGMNVADDDTLPLVVTGAEEDLIIDYGNAPFAPRTLTWDEPPVPGETATATWDHPGDTSTGDAQLQFFDARYGDGSVINLFQSEGDFSFNGSTLTVRIPVDADLNQTVFGRDLFMVEVTDCPAFDCTVTTELDLIF